MPPGVVPPRIARLAPASSYASGDEAIALAASAGLDLDPWQCHALRAALGERDDGQWAAYEVGLIVSRQNGKGAVLTARELAGMFLFGERLILHSAHEFDTSLEAFYRIVELIEATPALRKRVKKISEAHGKEGITLWTGQRLRFKARTLRGGRGFSGDVVILDEAMYLQTATMNALSPTMGARPNPQLWYVGSCVDQQEHPDGLTFSKVRDRAIAGRGGSLTFLEWSAPPPASGRPEDANGADESLWPLGNPGIGNRISFEYMRNEQQSMGRRGFSVEHLGIGDWPKEAEVEHLVPPDTWTGAIDVDVAVTDPVAFAVDVTPDRKRASIAMACWTPDGRVVAEVIEDRAGIGWVVPRVLELVRRWDPSTVVVDKNSPAATIIDGLITAGIEPDTTTAGQVAQATGGWLDDVLEHRFAHRDDPILNEALENATTRPLAGGIALDRSGAGYISPLVAVVLARWGLMLRGAAKPPSLVPVSLDVTGAPDAGHMQSIGF